MQNLKKLTTEIATTERGKFFFSLWWLSLWFIILTSCHAKKPASFPKIYPVAIATVESKSTPLFIETLGHVDAITAIDIQSRIEGELMGVHFAQGQEVKRGDLLFTIDPKPYEAQLRQAESSLVQNMATQALALEKVKRYELLARQDFYSQIDFETLQTDFASSSALVGQSKAQVDSARINLDYCRIYAPIDGLMGILEKTQGNLIGNQGATLATLNQISPIYITFSVPEFQLYRIQKSKGPFKVLAAHEDFTAEKVEGTLLALDNQVNANTGMIRLRATFDNEAKTLWPGQFSRVRLILEVAKDALLVPFSAIQYTQNGPTIFVVQDNIVEQRKVVLGQREDNSIIIQEGVKKGEEVVIEGQLNLYSGAKVSVHEPL